MIDRHKLPHNIRKYPFFKKIDGKDCFFFHIPKTGGTSISRAFSFPQPNRSIGIRKHNPLSTVKPLLDPLVWENAFKFCFVRNPWERVYSHYRFRCRKKKLRKEIYYSSFEKWLFYQLLEHGHLGNMRPQTHWIVDSNNQIDIDFIGRFENLENDFQKICAQFNFDLQLPHFNKSTLDYDYRTQFNKEMIDLVAEVYQSDIEMFQYSF